MVEGKIGPIELDHSETYDGNVVSIDGSEEFTLICTNRQARQIMGLASFNNNKTSNNNITLINSDNPWGIMWIDTSLGLSSNEDITHRGWYLITQAEPSTDLGPDYVHLNITAEKISANENEYLEMTYTPGVGDGTRLSHTYNLETEDYDLNDTFATFDAGNWSPMTTSTTTATPSITGDGDLTFTCQGTADGTAGQVVTHSVATYPKPWTLELNMKYASTPADYSNALNFWFGPNAATAPANYNNSVLLVFNVNKTIPTYSAYLFNAAGSSTQIIATTSTTAKSINWKVEADNGGYITIYVDTGSGYVKKYHGVTWISVSWDVYLNFQFANWDSTSASIESEFIKVYNMADSVSNNIVTLPATTPVTVADFNRVSSDGTIPCYSNPTESLYFYQEDASHFYDGSVKAYNSNYSDSTPQLVTWTDEVLDPSEFYVTNGLIKLTTNNSATTPIVFSYYTSPAWNDLQYLGTGESIKLIKPVYISPERHVYQINETLWTVNRGRHHVLVEHPTTPITYLEQDYYEHDSAVLVTPTSTPVSMQSTYYTNTYNTSPCTYGFQIVQTNPTNIYSDYIPATDITGLGWYDNSTSPTTSYNHYSQLANEFLTQTRTKVNVRQL